MSVYLLLAWLVGFIIFELLQWRFKIFGTASEEDGWDGWFIHSMCAVWPYHLVLLLMAVVYLCIFWVCDKVLGV